MSNSFQVIFRDCPPLTLDINDTALGRKWLDLVRRVWLREGAAIFRDPPRYDLAMLQQLADRANRELGWTWDTTDLSVANTTLMHKDIEGFLAQGFANTPEHLDELLHDIHFALHSVESGSQRNSWLQIEWFVDDGFPIGADEYPAQIAMEFGAIRLQNPYVGHHPLFVYQQRDHRDVAQTCRFHDLARPGICIVVDRAAGHSQLDWQSYRQWFEHHATEWVQQQSWERIKAYTGHPVIGRVRNCNALDECINRPYLEFDRLEF